MGQMTSKVIKEYWNHDTPQLADVQYVQAYPYEFYFILGPQYMPGPSSLHSQVQGHRNNPLATPSCPSDQEGCKIYPTVDEWLAQLQTKFPTSWDWNGIYEKLDARKFLDVYIDYLEWNAMASTHWGKGLGLPLERLPCCMTR